MGCLLWVWFCTLRVAATVANNMKKSTSILFTLLFCLNLYSQKDSIKIVDFGKIEKQLLTSDLNESGCLNYDFAIVDSLYFNEKSNKADILTSDYGNDFELNPGDGKSIIKFECNKETPWKCFTYSGYSKNAEVHIITKCRDVCELYLIDSYSGSIISIPSAFDSGSFPAFVGKYMILYSSFYDSSFDKYYDYRSIIDIYELKNTNNLKEKFKYVGSIQSKNWSIQELYESVNQNSFLMKIFDEQNEFEYIEITVE